MMDFFWLQKKDIMEKCTNQKREVQNMKEKEFNVSGETELV